MSNNEQREAIRIEIEGKIKKRVAEIGNELQDDFRYIKNNIKFPIFCHHCNKWYTKTWNSFGRSPICPQLAREVCGKDRQNSFDETATKLEKKGFELLTSRRKYKTKYTGNKSELKLRCFEGHIIKDSLDHIQHKLYKGCPECLKIEKGNKFIHKERAKYGEKYIYDENHFVSMNKKMEFTCSIHNETFVQTPTAHLKCDKYKTCKQCDKDRKDTRTKRIITGIQERCGENRFDLSLVSGDASQQENYSKM